MMNSDSDSDMDAHSSKSSYKSRSPVSSGSRVSRPQTPQDHCRNLTITMEEIQTAKNTIKTYESLLSQKNPIDIQLFSGRLRDANITRYEK
ncbi:hypothetical protein TNCT_176331, partial [Trichonephila clavata]